MKERCIWMQYTIYDDIRKFKEETFEALIEKEAENNLIIGNVIRLETTPVKGSLMATVKDETGKLLVILNMTPPFGLCLYALPTAKTHDALNFLAKTLYEKGTIFQDAIGAEDTVEAFSTFYCAYSNMTSKVSMRLNAYELTQVKSMPKSPGRLRAATKEDLFYLPYWQQSYRIDCEMKAASFEKTVESLLSNIENENIYIWEDEMPVSTLAKGRKLVNGIAVSGVYTPPHLRGKGYALASVSTLSQNLLDEGYKFITLYADANNSTTNKIYKEIGYKLIGCAKELTFFKG